MSVTVQCPSCQTPFQVEEALLGRSGRCKRCNERFTLSADRSTRRGALASGEADLPKRFGRFEVRQRLGAGAFGIVYRAYDAQLDREVALKVPNAGALADPRRAERFLREAKAAARLRHPNIVPVFEAGREGETLYLASAFVEGEPLSRAVGDGVAAERAARLVRELAEALAYAHSQGIVHRDVKPDNVLLDEDDHVHLTDFGLAARQDDVNRMTNEGAVLGTPSYMAPEQAAGKSAEAGPAADQYAAGVVLYELLTGTVPFEGPVQIVLYHAVRTPPEPPSRRKAGVPRDLETVCLKAMAKRPEERYANCQALANDLRRWLDGEPIAARRPGVVERAWRWAWRNRTAAALAAVATVGVVAAAWLGLMAVGERTRAGTLAEETAEQTRRAEREAATAGEATRQATASAAQADAARHARLIDEALRAWRGYDVERARTLSADALPRFRDAWETRYVAALCRLAVSVYPGHDAPTCLAWSADGQFVASADAAGSLRVWDSATGKVRFVMAKAHAGGVECAAWSADGKRLATGGGDWAVKVWDAEAGRLVREIKGHNNKVLCAAWSGTGARLATGGMDGALRVWDVAGGVERFQFAAGGPRGVSLVRWEPGDGGVLVCTGDGEWYVVDAEKGQSRRNGRAPRTADTAGWDSRLTWRDDGNAAAVSLKDGGLKLWLESRGQKWRPVGGVPSAECVAWSADGKRLATGGKDTTIRVWDAEELNQLFALEGHSAAVTAVAWSGDGRRVASAGRDKTLRVWHLGRQSERLTIPSKFKSVAVLSVSADGKRVVGGGKYSANAQVMANYEIQQWDTVSGKELALTRTPIGSGLAAISGDGRRVALASGPVQGGPAAGGGGDTVFLRDGFPAADLNLVPPLAIWGHADRVSALAWSADGKRAASASRTGEVKLSAPDSQPGQRELIGHEGGVHALAIRPDGGRVATGGLDRTVRVWDAVSTKELHTLRGHAGSVSALAWSPDGCRLASASLGPIFVWDADSGRKLFLMTGHDRATSALAWSPDGERLASGGLDGAVRLWDTTTGQQVLSLEGHAGAVNSVAWSADGKTLASGGDDGTIKIWVAE